MLFGCFILLLEIQTKTTSSTQAAVAATASARAIKRDKKQAYEHIRPDHTFEVYGKKFFVLFCLLNQKHRSFVNWHWLYWQIEVESLLRSNCNIVIAPSSFYITIF